MENPPSSRIAINKSSYFIFFFVLFVSLTVSSVPVFAKTQSHETRRFMNNKTFYSSQIPLLKPSSSLLELPNSTLHEPISMAFDASKAKKLAEIAKKNARFKSSRRKCMKWVRMALTKWITSEWIRNAPDLNTLPNDNKKNQKHVLAGRSGDDFKKWALDNPVSLCENLKLANASDYPDLVSREGAIYLYGKTSCGFSKRYGHAEILTNSAQGEACSDHCRIMSRPCVPDMVLIPVAHCDWIEHNKKEIHYTPLIHQKPILLSRYTESREPAR